MFDKPLTGRILAHAAGSLECSVSCKCASRPRQFSAVKSVIQGFPIRAHERIQQDFADFVPSRE